ncbi:exodeoxyribonuclease VII large subunit [Thermotoga petrophila]|uniref:exodeoxyribonuclease VII large subunit n=1 Tax=Thermotoga petrophila TaxID=93929 RepID=UPI002FDFB40E
MKDYTYSVTEINEYIKDLIEGDPYLTNVSVYGEISGVRPRKGHIFFSLVEENARLECVIFGGDNMGIRLQEGRMALVEGSVSVYIPHGTYRFICSNVRYLDQAGMYQIKFETTLKKLLEEGLLSRPKKTVPRFPRKIGIITSRDSAALQDVIRTARERKAPIEIYVFHTFVQGDSAREELIKALRKANEYDLDLVMIVRGGGSKEDLWVFNEEDVIREILKLRHPVVTGIGHEIDRVIADFVADVSMHTPTGAAEYVIPDASEIHEDLDSFLEKLIASLSNRFDMEERRLETLYFRLRMIGRRKLELNEFKIEKVKELTTKLRKKLIDYFEHNQEKLDSLGRMLESLNPLRPLERGFVLVKKGEEIVKESSILKQGDAVSLVFKDGTKKAQVIG